MIHYLDQLLIHKRVSGVVDPGERVVLPVGDGWVEEPWGVVDDAEQKDRPDDRVSGVDVAPKNNVIIFIVDFEMFLSDLDKTFYNTNVIKLFLIIIY